MAEGTKIWHFQPYHEPIAKLDRQLQPWPKLCDLSGGSTRKQREGPEQRVHLHRCHAVRKTSFLGPSMVFTNVTNPRSRRQSDEANTLKDFGSPRRIHWRKRHDSLWSMTSGKYRLHWSGNRGDQGRRRLRLNGRGKPRTPNRLDE